MIIPDLDGAVIEATYHVRHSVEALSILGMEMSKFLINIL